jgi:hypothetical protein
MEADLKVMDPAVSTIRDRLKRPTKETSMKSITVILTAAFMFAVIASISTTTTTASAASIVAIPLATPEKRLNKEEVGALLDDLQEGLSNQIEDASAIEAIGERWDARKDLVGKTRAQILELQMADVRSVVADKETREAVWASWKEGDDESAGAPAAKSLTKTESWIKLVHNGMFIAHFDVTWDDPGKPSQKFHSANKTQGYQETLTFPGDTSNIQVHITNDTGLVWEPKHDIINRSLSSAEINKCLVIDGTTLQSKISFDPCDAAVDEGKSASGSAHSAETWIGLSHRGAFIAHFDVSWSEPGKPIQTFLADNGIGYNETLRFPHGTSNIRVKITNDTGLAWEPTREIINRSLTSAELNKCLVVDGSTLASKIRFETCDPAGQ